MNLFEIPVKRGSDMGTNVSFLGGNMNAKRTFNLVALILLSVIACSEI